MAPRGRHCPSHPVLAQLQWSEVAEHPLCSPLGLAGERWAGITLLMQGMTGMALVAPTSCPGVALQPQPQLSPIHSQTPIGLNGLFLVLDRAVFLQPISISGLSAAPPLPAMVLIQVQIGWLGPAKAGELRAG